MISLPLGALFVHSAIGQSPQILSQTLTLQLEAIAAKERVGPAEFPHLIVRVRNLGKIPIPLVMPGDGSDGALRTPVFVLSQIVEPEGSTESWVNGRLIKSRRATHPTNPPLNPSRGCGNINCLRRGEIFTIPPFKEQKVYDRTIAKTGFGRYRIVAYYINDPKIPWKGEYGGKHEEGAIELLQKTSKCNLRSNEVTFQVAPF